MARTEPEENSSSVSARVRVSQAIFYRKKKKKGEVKVFFCGKNSCDEWYLFSKINSAYPPRALKPLGSHISKIQGREGRVYEEEDRIHFPAVLYLRKRIDAGSHHDAITKGRGTA